MTPHWQRRDAHGWEAPLDFATRFAASPELALLYSGRAEQASGQHSFLFVDAATQIAGAHWNDLPAAFDQPDLPDWVGYFGYEMGFDANLPASMAAWPRLWLTRYRRLFRFDHHAQRIDEFARFDASQELAPLQALPALPAIHTLASPMPRDVYLRHVRATIDRIHAGDFYQANITRKFTGSFGAAPHPLATFRALCQASPAPYGALIRHGAQAILSSSPESFLTLSEGTITSRPIKGSARRSAEASDDAQLREALQQSDKNQAENLMIVDLMRHDLAQISQPGSVQVAARATLHSYANIHHLISTITARLRKGSTVRDALRACMPPGSMTGAPKRAAMQWIATREGLQRGVYSGALGWMGHDCADFSVVIRTVLIDGVDFEFQVGGGIVADSDPEEEWRETLVKTCGIATALGIDEARLAAL